MFPRVTTVRDGLLRRFLTVWVSWVDSAGPDSRRSLVSASRRCSHRGLAKRTIAKNQRMTSQCPDYKRKANETGQEPKRQGWQRSPKRQVRSIVDIERCE